MLDGRYIISDLIHFLERAKGEPVSLLFGDVDDFKQFNSKHGYKAGDAVSGGIITGTALVGVGRYASGVIMALIRCIASLLIAITARLLDSLGL